MSKLKEQILILRSDNKSYNEIAKILGCSKSIVGYYCNDITNSKQRKSTSLWRNTLKGRIKSRLCTFCARISHGCRRISNRTWRKRLRRYIEHFQNRGILLLDWIFITKGIDPRSTNNFRYLISTLFGNINPACLRFLVINIVLKNKALEN